MIANRYLKYAGIFFILLALIFNPILLGQIFSPNKSLNKFNLQRVVFIEVFLLILGLFMIYPSKIHPFLKYLLGYAVIAAVFLEIVLRIFPLILGDTFANEVLTKYQADYRGIYDYDPLIKMSFMRPNFRTKMYFNRYTWEHQTDSLGFRNPSDRTQADIVLLGDSFIYGHGVNQDQTVGYFLEKMTDYKIINLASQGDCAFTQTYILNQYGIKFHPQYVIYFFYNNDISNLSLYLDKKDMINFINTPIENMKFEKRIIKPTSRSKNKIVNYLISNFERGFFLTTAFKLTHKNIKKKLSKIKKHKSKNETPDETQGNRPAGTNKSDKETLNWKYTKKAILLMNYVSEKNSARFVIVPITLENDGSFSILKDFAEENKISFIDTHIVFEDRSNFLPRDGHFSEHGHRQMAKLVAEYLRLLEGQL